MERWISGRNEEWSEEWKKVLAMLPKQINLTEAMTYIQCGQFMCTTWDNPTLLVDKLASKLLMQLLPYSHTHCCRHSCHDIV